MDDELTRLELAQLIARSKSAEDVTLASSRVLHWTEKGLLNVVGGKSVGRGRERRYAISVVAWCRLLNGMADRGFGIAEMAAAVARLRHYRTNNPEERDLIDAAMRGEGEPGFLIVEKGEAGAGTSRGSSVPVSGLPLHPDPKWASGWFINITELCKSGERK